MDCLRSLSTLVATIAVFGAIATGCSSGTEEPAAPEAPETSAAEPAAPAAEATGRPTADETGVTGKAPDPSRALGELPEGIVADIPEHFPSDLPIYPGAQPAQGKGALHEGTPMAAVQLMSGDSPDQTYDYYLRFLESDGWTIEEAKEMGPNSAISAAKGDRKISLMMAPTEDGGTNIFVITQG